MSDPPLRVPWDIRITIMHGFDRWHAEVWRWRTIDAPPECIEVFWCETWPELMARLTCLPDLH